MPGLCFSTFLILGYLKSQENAVGLTYRESGVDISAGERFVDVVRRKLKDSGSENIGLFSGLFDLSHLDYRNPVLVASTDGVGTKLLLAKETKKYKTIGIDLVAMCVNDIITAGARPIFFLDYLATSKLNITDASEVLDGIVQGCRDAGCVLLGGETAEMPGVYKPGTYELAGFAVGVVEREKAVDGKTVKAGDSLIGIRSSGIHANGLSLARKALFYEKKYPFDAVVSPLVCPLIDELLTPTRIYVKTVLDVLTGFSVGGIAHITGGGLYSNTMRIIPEGLDLKIDWASITTHPVFSVIKDAGNIDEAEMRHTFNMGIGLVFIVRRKEAPGLHEYLRRHGEEPVQIGEVVARKV